MMKQTVEQGLGLKSYCYRLVEKAILVQQITISAHFKTTCFVFPGSKRSSLKAIKFQSYSGSFSVNMRVKKRYVPYVVEIGLTKGSNQVTDGKIDVIC